MDRGAWQAIVHHTQSDMTDSLHTLHTHLDSGSYPGAILFPGDIWQCLIWGHVWLSERGVGAGKAGSGGGTGICGGGQGHANHPPGPSTGPQQRALRVSNAGERKPWAGTGPELLLSESFPLWGLAPRHHRCHMLLLWFWGPGG